MAAGPAGGIELARAALALDPSSALAWTYLGDELAASDPAEAEAAYRRAVALDPAFADAHNQLGVLLQRRGDRAAAEACYRAAVAADPSLAAAWANLGFLRLEARDMAGAEAALRRALALEPALVKARGELGLALKHQGRLEEAVAEFRHALEVRPEDADARFNLSRCLLQRGYIAEGFALYDARWRASEFPSVRRAFDLPVWKGEPPAGRRILVWGEQGLGDEILFYTLLPDLLAAGASLVVECDPRLAGLIARSLPEAEVVPRLDPPHPRLARGDIDFQIPAGGLARRLRPGLVAFAGHRPWLRPEPELAAQWRARVEALGPGLKVGLCWTSRLRSSARDPAYMALRDWLPLFRVPGVRVVSLQYNAAAVAGEVAAFEAATGAVLHRFDGIDLENDLEAAAALTAGLDLVVTAPTSVGEMAAALGVPAWRAGPPGDWTQLGTGVRPWHPAMRVVSGPPGAELAGRVAAMLAGLAHQPAGMPASQPAILPVSVAPEPAAMERALALHQAGDLAGAAALYEAVLRERPSDADALHLLGLVHHQSGRPEDALPLLRRALEADPGFHQAHNSLGAALLSLGRREEAAACFRRALELSPGYDKARANLARALGTG